MIAKKKLCKNNDPSYPVYPDTSVYDVDIDFELNNGKGAWVVILKRPDVYPRPRPHINEAKQKISA